MAKNSKDALQEIPGYLILRKIGQGGMGAVFLAEQESMARQVALKILPKSLADKETFKERFFQEARSAGRLNHPNIVTAIDANEANGFCYLAMEYVEGVSVLAKIKDEGVLAEEESLSIGLQIATGLAHAWENNLIHRDVKPENILYTKDGIAKLCDLGIAKASVSDDDANLTQTGKAIGTPKYISPEQARGLSDLDFRADVYSLGASLYHMLCGHPPFDGKSSPAIMIKHIKEKLPPLREQNPDLAPGTALVVEKMLEKSPDDRYLDAESLLEDLELILDGESPEHAAPPSVSSSVRASVRASVRRVTTRSSAPVRPTTQNRRVVSEPKKPPIVPIIVGGVCVVLLIIFLLVGGGGADDPKSTPVPPDKIKPVTPNSTAVKRIFAQAIEFRRSGNFAEAKNGFMKVIKNYPQATKLVRRSTENMAAILLKEAEILEQKHIVNLIELRKVLVLFKAISKDYGETASAESAQESADILVVRIKSLERKVMIGQLNNNAKAALAALIKRRFKPNPAQYLKDLQRTETAYGSTKTSGAIVAEIAVAKKRLADIQRQNDPKVKLAKLLNNAKKEFRGRNWRRIDGLLGVIIKSKEPQKLRPIQGEVTNLARTGGRARTRALALRALKRFDRKAATDVAMQHLSDRNEAVRLGAINLLRGVGYKAAQEKLLEIKSNDPSPVVQDAAKKALEAWQ